VAVAGETVTPPIVPSDPAGGAPQAATTATDTATSHLKRSRATRTSSAPIVTHRDGTTRIVSPSSQRARAPSEAARHASVW
jgi:hypothetical protein